MIIVFEVYESNGRRRKMEKSKGFFHIEKENGLQLYDQRQMQDLEFEGAPTYIHSQMPKS